jgi:hypothetical protein
MNSSMTHLLLGATIATVLASLFLGPVLDDGHTNRLALTSIVFALLTAGSCIADALRGDR